MTLLVNAGQTSAAEPVVFIQKKGSDLAWYNFAELNRSRTSLDLTGTGTFRAKRRESGAGYAVDKD